MTNFAMVTFPVMVTLTNFTKGDKNATAIYATGYKNCESSSSFRIDNNLKTDTDLL